MINGLFPVVCVVCLKRRSACKALQAIPPHVLEDNRENDADAVRKCLFPVYRLAVDARLVG